MTERVKVTITMPGFPNLTATKGYDASIPFESPGLDELMNDPTPQMCRLTSPEPKDG